ncbi:MAG: serine/threonine-protein kinase [Planctomycetota bacterium]|jgi:tetratricopeptide (TPR) repeat protein
MIGNKLNRYTIVSELGTGGMGKVYLAVTPSGHRVALKVVHPHLVNTPGFFKRFLREGEIGRKVKHENVVRTLDVDATTIDDKQVNYMVMEFVRGKSLRELLVELGTVPETLLREIALQLSAGLNAIHSADIIHRDIKPENVLITRDHTVRIMDLGVAKMQEASVALTLGGQFAGSYLYAAPEQFEKDTDVGPAADLYALGVLLYELATADNPFRADSVSAIMAKHSEEEPPPLRDRAPEVSPFFAAVVHTLLAKDPSDRFASAAELNEILDEGELSDWWGAREKELRSDTTQLPSINVRRECGLFGRHKEMKMLRDAWERAKLGEGGVILIEGEAGIGKTRLLDEFAREAAADDAHLLYGAYTPGGGLGGLSEAIINKFGSVNLADGLGPYIPETPTLVTSFAALVKHETPPAGAAALQLDALHTVGCHLFRNLSADKPMLCEIDDLHFAPQESLHFIVALARALSAQRTLLVLTARSGEMEKTVEHFARMERFRRHELGRLLPNEVAEMLGETLRSDALAEKLGPQIAEKSDGIPLFVLEIAHSVQERGEEEVTEIEIPSAVRDLIGARLQDLTDDERNLLDAAAVQGFTFDPDLVARVLEVKPIQILQRLAALERRSGVVHAHGSGYRFDHHQIQEVLYSAQPAALRDNYHSLTADALEAREKLAAIEEPGGGPAYFMAYHRLRGTNPADAKRYLKGGLAHVDNDYRNDAHIALCNLALETKGLLSDEERCEILIEKGTKHGHLGQRSQQGAAMEEAVKIADGIGDPKLRCDARGQLGWHLWALGQYPESKAVFEEALEIVEDDAQRTRLSGRLASVLSTLGHQEEALQLEQPSTNNRGLCFQYLGHYAEALDCYEQGVHAEVDTAGRPIALLNVGRIQAALGDPETARTTIEGARAELHAMGLRRPESYAIHRLGDVAAQMGQTEEAEHLYEQALSLRREIAYPSGVAETLLAQGRLLQKQGKDANAVLKEAQGVAREIDRPDEFVLSAVYLGGGVAAEAALKSHGPRMRVVDRMEAHFELWRATKKPEHLAEAQRLHKLLLEHAPEESRAAMLENTPLHREIEAATS